MMGQVVWCLFSSSDVVKYFGLCLSFSAPEGKVICPQRCVKTFDVAQKHVSNHKGGVRKFVICRQRWREFLKRGQAVMKGNWNSSLMLFWSFGGE